MRRTLITSPTIAGGLVAAPTVVDADAVQPEQAIELLAIRGGGIVGEEEGSPKAQLATLPNTAHIGWLGRADELVAIVPTFLDAPKPEATLTV